MDLIELTDGKITIHAVDRDVALNYISKFPQFKIIESKPKKKIKNPDEALSELISIICNNCGKDSCLNCYIREDKKIIYESLHN